MATIKYAVLIPSSAPALNGVPLSLSLMVGHLYQHRADADKCAQVYLGTLSVPAFVAELVPALTIIRHSDLWGVLEAETQQLHTFVARDAAPAQGDVGLRALAAPIRRAMPVQHGVPQFAPTARPGPPGIRVGPQPTKAASGV
jgi:hypothetical protein